VRKATHLPTGMQIAAKIYDKAKLAEPSNKKSYLKEVQVLKTLCHAQIPLFYDIIESFNQVYLIMELAKG
jgi:serine/threonine protein kinase